MKATIHLGVAGLVLGLVLGGCREEPPVPAAMEWGPIPGRSLEEYRVTVRAKPEIEAKDGYSLLRLPAVKGRPIEVLCGESYSPWFATLPKDKALTFTVWQTKRVDWHTSEGQEEYSWQSEIELIKDGDTVIHDAAVCPLHRVRMERRDVEIAYGLPSPDLFEAMEKFSGGPGFTLGGCVVMSGSPKTERGYVCPDCVATYQEWSKVREAEWEERRAKEPKDS